MPNTFIILSPAFSVPHALDTFACILGSMLSSPAKLYGCRSGSQARSGPSWLELIAIVVLLAHSFSWLASFDEAGTEVIPALLLNPLVGTDLIRCVSVTAYGVLSHSE